MSNTFAAIAAVALMVPVYSTALDVTCTQGCASTGEDSTVNLILRTDESTPVTISWSSATDPTANNRTVVLYAGNPQTEDTIFFRGTLDFVKMEDKWQASYEFPGDMLGRGTFVTVVVAKNQSSSGKRVSLGDRILDWRAFRLLTNEDKARRESIPEPGSAWSVTVTPALLQAKSAHGYLPPYRGGDKRPWWSLVDLDGNTTDMDLDGEYTGVPGIGVQVSTPWHTRAEEEENWQDLIREKLTGVHSHQVRFGEIEWYEQPDREIELGAEVRPIYLRHYYTVVSLYTSASVRSFDKREVKSFNPFSDPSFFSHETTARIKHTADPRFWASYSRREYTADKDLLSLLKNHIRRSRSVPGLAGILTDDGDGGNITYTLGFYIQVRPWELQTDTPATFKAGLVGIDVVAARGGIGGLVSSGSAGRTALEKIWCNVVRCDSEDHSLDLDKPPEGYWVAQPVAKLGTFSGNLPFTTEPPDYAERAVPEYVPGAISLPDKARFGITANLRAGALVQEAPRGYAQNIVPIDTYAQFVLKLTVAMVPEIQLVTSEEATIASSAEFSANITVPSPRKSILQKLVDFVSQQTRSVIIVLVLIVAVLVAASFLVSALKRRRD